MRAGGATVGGRAGRGGVLAALAGLFVELERQRRALPQHRQRRGVYLDFTGGDLGVGIALGADLDDAVDGDAALLHHKE